MKVRSWGVAFTVFGLVAAGGCVNVLPGNGDDPIVSAVVGKANTIANSVGGQEGYGGTTMTGYVEHTPDRMGFRDAGDLASGDRTMTMRLHNRTDQDCTFELSYFASHMSLDEQMMDVEVGAGETTAVDVSCAEIIGMGSLEVPGSRACLLADGEEVDNRMAVPGFLGLDFECGDTYDHVLMQDVDDLDGDGDTEELVIVSDAMEFHRLNGGPMGHRHGTGPGMMGSHMDR